MTLIEELDAVLEKIENSTPLEDSGRASIDFIDMNSDAIRAALELAEVVKNGVRETVYAGGVVDCSVPLEYGTEVIIIPAPPSAVGGGD